MSNSNVVAYRDLAMESAQPNSARTVRLIEWISSIATIGILLIAVPLLYRGGAIGITSVNQLGRFLCYAIVAMGLDLIWGYTGILSLCQAMFFCIGAYAIGMHIVLHGPLDGDGIPRCLFVVTSVFDFQLPVFWKPFESLPIALLLGTMLPGALAYVLGYFAFRSRVRGVYFSIITQAMTLAVFLIFQRNETRLCGTNGMTNFETLAGWDLTSSNVKLGLYVVTVVAVVLVYIACRMITMSRLGRLLVAVRDSESRLRFAGYNPLKLKLFAFTVAAIIAGIGGMLYTPQNGIITPSKMMPGESILIVIWVAVGGRGTLSGAVIGTLLINIFANMLSSTFPDAWPYFLGVLFIAVPLFMPEGLIGLWRRFARPDVNINDLPAETVPVKEGAVA